MAVKKGKSNEAEILVHQDYYFDKNSSGDFMYWVIDYIENAPVPDNVGKVLYSGEKITADFTQYEKDGVIIVRPRIRARYV